MNIRSLTRGDGVVIGAAVLLFIASFLDLYSYSAAGYSGSQGVWDNLGTGLGTYMGAVIGAVLIVLNRCLPQPRKVLGLDLGVVGTAFTILSAWTLFWTLVDVPSGLSVNATHFSLSRHASTHLATVLASSLCAMSLNGKSVFG